MIRLISPGPFAQQVTFLGPVEDLYEQLLQADPTEAVRWEHTNCTITATAETMLAWVTLARLNATGSSSVVERRSDAPEVARETSGEGTRVPNPTAAHGSTPASPTVPAPPTPLSPRRWGLTLGERLGLPECPYARRWIIQTPAGSLRVHSWYHADDERAMHDHPWWFVTLVLRGGYTDYNEAGSDRLGRWSVRYRPALHRHYVDPEPGTLTVLLTGPNTRRWGFWVKGKFRKSSRYFYDHGHPPCKEET